MSVTRRDALGLAAAFAAAGALPARAQSDWPQRSLRILVGTSPGGSPDIVSRLLADKFAPTGSASRSRSRTTPAAAAASPPAWCRTRRPTAPMTLLTAGYASGAAVGKFPFDGDNTFGFVSMVCAYPFVYAVPKDSPIQSFADMLARAKASPGKLTYVITSLGSVYHLIGSWVGMKAGIDMVPVPYRGSSAAVTDVLAGRVDVMLDTATSGFPRVRSGQFRALAVTSPERYPLLPDAPTVAETLPGVHYMSWLGMAAAPHTPRPIVDRLNTEVHHALELPDVQQKLREGGNIATPTTPEAMRKQIDDEIANWKQLIKANNIKVQIESALVHKAARPRNFPAKSNTTGPRRPSREQGEKWKCSSAVNFCVCPHSALPAFRWSGRGAFAADYPTKPVRWVVGYVPAGSTDILARLMGAVPERKAAPAVRHREQARCRQQHRHRIRHQLAARRLHGLSGQSGQRHQRVALQEAELQFRARHGAGRRHHARAERHDREPRHAGEDRRRVHRPMPRPTRAR